ncbi:16S rRNA m(2)G 1207 methyltransferase [Tropicibacter naphthalenivorans]|uniref:Ribosomal RNA large subunit methyltransferase G n=2 Tax=Tropicibacter naphthalenivorans TaxID=441103 RepID=A0A0N7LZV8_9RHOB|nr:Ribosomal RNA large subunit methyltransferase G [Tropicibacter naphthalenivorans]SMC81369.1 16S rRNA m(2)G 1207 methyltransferase [Tropicibacter naphthalenivorans]
MLPDGKVALFGASSEGPLPEGDVEVIQTFRPDYDALIARGATVLTAPEGPYAGAVVTLGRARDLNEARIARAVKIAPGGLIVVDGAKTDGIEPIIKALRAKVALLGQVSKAHGKCVWFTADEALLAWDRPAMSANKDGDFTAPGVFSADGADPASVALAQALPPLKGNFADLGAGWGWLSREILRHEGVKSLHLVEAEKAALDCAEVNVTDPRASFHWADATRWTPPTKLDGVVMNPPFHTGRKAEPALGQAFIATAAKALAPHGQLWMVANRHLPYEQALTTLFRDVTEIAGSSKFKILHAMRPNRAKR